MSTEEAPEVTFVGGRAVEQTESLDSNLEPDEREAAKEAVRKAIEEAGKSSAESAKEGRARDPYKPPGAKRDDEPSAPERGPDGKFLPKGGQAEDKDSEKPEKPAPKPDEQEEIDPDKATVKQLLKAREKVAAVKREAQGVQGEIQRQQQEFQKQQQAFQSQVQAFQKAQLDLQRQQAALKQLREDPARAIRELNYDPEQFILDLAQEGTPEGQARRQQREMERQLKELQDWKSNQLQTWKQQQQMMEEQQRQHARTNTVDRFVKLGADAEKYPHVAAFYKGRERALVAEGDLTAEEYRSISGGREGSLEDIMDYIEDQLAERAKSWYSIQQNGGTKVAAAKPEPVQSKPKSKGKSLSPEVSGERRTLSNKLLDLDGDERLEAAKQAVAVALANSRTE